MRIPQPDQSVDISGEQVNEIKAAPVVPGAFGEDVGAALQKLGNAGVDLSTKLQEHVLQENFWRGEAAIADKNLKLNDSFNTMMNSTDPTTVPAKFSNTAPLNAAANADAATGVATQPKGYLNRLGFNAVGSTTDFVNQAGPMRQQAVAEYDGNAQLQKVAAERFDTTFKSYYDQVSKHEATQYRSGMNGVFNAQSQQDIISTASATDPASLMKGISLIKNSTTNEFQYKGADPDVINLAIQKNIGDAVAKSVVNTLTQTGDVTQAKALLDTAKDEIPADRYDKIDTMITTGMEKIEKQTIYATNQKTISGQANVLQGLATGKENWMNIDDVANMVKTGDVSEKFAKAYTDVVTAKGNYQPQEDQNQNVPKFIDAIYNAKDQNELHSTLTNMMEAHKNMSQDEMAILINSALKRSGSLPLSVKLDNTSNADPKQQNIDAGARSVINFGKRNGLSNGEISNMYANYYTATSKGAGIPQAIDAATKQYAVAKYPIVATLPATPTAVVAPGSGVKYLNFSSGTKVAPARIWNPKTGVFDVNTNRAETSGGDSK